MKLFLALSYLALAFAGVRELDFFNIQKNCAVIVVKKWTVAPGEDREIVESPTFTFNTAKSSDISFTLTNQKGKNCNDDLKYGQCVHISEDRSVISNAVTKDFSWAFDTNSHCLCCGTTTPGCSKLATNTECTRKTTPTELPASEGPIPSFLEQPETPASETASVPAAEVPAAEVPAAEVPAVEEPEELSADEKIEARTFGSIAVSGNVVTFRNKIKVGTLFVCKLKNKWVRDYSGVLSSVPEDGVQASDYVGGAKFKVECKHSAYSGGSKTWEVTTETAINGGCSPCIGPVFTNAQCTATEISPPDNYLPVKLPAGWKGWEGTCSTGAITVAPFAAPSSAYGLAPFGDEERKDVVADVPVYKWLGTWFHNTCPAVGKSSSSTVQRATCSNTQKPVCLDVKKCAVKSDTRGGESDSCKTADDAVPAIEFTISCSLYDGTLDVSELVRVSSNGKESGVYDSVKKTSVVLKTDSNGMLYFTRIPFGATCKVCETVGPSWRIPESAKTSSCKDSACCKELKLDSYDTFKCASSTPSLLEIGHREPGVSFMSINENVMHPRARFDQARRLEPAHN